MEKLRLYVNRASTVGASLTALFSLWQGMIVVVYTGQDTVHGSDFAVAVSQLGVLGHLEMLAAFLAVHYLSKPVNQALLAGTSISESGK
ncbi:MAG: hypothetical protein U1F55_03265 [Chitinivorax sp.]|jgi:hypothetical protein